jgi:hypothetical protein
VGDSAGGVFVAEELLAVEEVIHFTFGFEEDDDGAFFAVDFFDVFDDSSVEFEGVDFLELDESLAVESIN